MKKSITLGLMAMALTVQAQQGGITPDMLKEIKTSYKHTPSDKAIYNAMAGTSIAILAKTKNDLPTSTHISPTVWFRMALPTNNNRGVAGSLRG